MTEITVNPDLLARLNGLAEPLVFRDQQGRVLGRFVPDLVDDLEPGISMEEMRHRSATFQGRPLADLLAKWEQER